MKSNYRKTPVIYQMEATECGAASLSMVFAYYGRYMPLEEMRVETGVSRDGCNAANIIRAARKYGLEGKGRRCEPDKLRTLRTPCILHWNFNHFVVLEGFKGKVAYINDPAVGRRRVTWEELDDCFTGVVLTFEKTPAFTKNKKKDTLWRFICGRIRGQYGVIFKLMYIGMLLVFPGLILSVLSQVFIDDVLGRGFTDWVVKILLAMGACVLLKMGLSYYRDLMLQKLKSKMSLLSSYGFLSHLLKLPMVFFDQRYPGDLVDRMGNNDEVNEFLAGELAETVLNIGIALFYLVILLLYDWRLTLVGMISVVVCIATTILSRRRMADANMKLQMTGGKLYGALCAGIGITDTIKASGVEHEYATKILGYQAKVANDEQKTNRFQQLIGVIPDAASAVTDILLLLTGGLLVINGEMTTGMLVAFNTLFDSFAEPVNSLVNFANQIQALKSNMSRVEDIVSYPADDEENSREDAAIRYRKLSGRVELQDVAFGYSRLKPPLVEHFDFSLLPGQSIAFVGPSGCGKSTVGKLVSGLYHPWEGRVLFDGCTRADIAKEDLNASIQTVSQKITLFSGTVKDNLTMWNDAIPEEDMIQAAKDACIHDFIVSQPGGYQYMLTENATNLSGGQRQRMEIARALTTNPTILIMDEATSALDALVEKQILDNIRRRGCTCIIVAHRLSAFRDCDQILVMKQGKIVQRGNHESLIDVDGLYRDMIGSL